MKYLVTGHEGFIGKALFKKLQKITSVNDAVIGYDDNSFSFYGKPLFFKLHKFLYDQKPDVIFHVGACSDTQQQDINKMMQLNLEATNILIEYCRLHGATMIYSSSAACYGTHVLPNTLYGWSKYAGEKLTEAIGGVSLRYFNVYGHDESHKGKMASVAYQAYNKSEFLLFPKNPKRDFIYINDVVSANIHALENYDNLSGGVYDVATCVHRSFEDIMDIIGVNYKYHPESAIPENYQFETCANPVYLMKDWYAKYNLEQGMEEYLKILSSSSDNIHIAS
jgi:ADP-L-glycero-D-manno-heptose 6-epimerase